jgi:hypothetical protein
MKKLPSICPNLAVAIDNRMQKYFIRNHLVTALEKLIWMITRTIL